MKPDMNHPWWVDTQGNEFFVIRDSNGKAVCLVPMPEDKDQRLVQATLAELIALAPELLASVQSLTSVLRLSDVVGAQSLELVACSDEDREATIDDALSLLELLADEGVTP